MAPLDSSDDQYRTDETSHRLSKDFLRVGVIAGQLGTSSTNAGSSEIVPFHSGMGDEVCVMRSSRSWKLPEVVAWEKGEMDKVEGD